MPNRILRESILDSDRVNALSAEAEVFYRRLMSVVDDYGRFPADPRILRSRCYPLRTDAITCEQVGKWLAECGLGEEPLVISYESDGKSYLQLQNLGDPRAKKSKYPSPSDCGCLQMRADVDTREQMFAGRVAQPSPKANTKAEAEGGSDSEDTDMRMDRWDLDETFAPVVTLWGGFMGDLAIPDDYRAAHFYWRNLDWTQQQARIERLREYVEVADPQYMCKLPKFLQSEWQRRPRTRKPSADEFTYKIAGGLQ